MPVEDEDGVRDLKEVENFASIPASGTIQIGHALPLEEIVGRGDRDIESMHPGIRYRVWMKQAFLDSLGYWYWGCLDGDLKDKKLSDCLEIQTSDCETLESDDWALRIGDRMEVRGNVGVHGPEFELVE